MIRARARQHLENLMAECPALSADILESDEADYRFRIIAEKAIFADALRSLALRLVWTNVKSDAERHRLKVGQKFIVAMHEAWRSFLRIQNSP